MLIKFWTRLVTNTLRLCWSTLPAQHHTIRLPQPKRHYTPASKCHHEPWGC